MDVVKQPVLDLLETPGTPALSSTSDVPVIETKPDATPAVADEKTPEAEQPAGDSEAPEQQEEAATSSTDEQDGQPTGQPRGVGKALAKLRREAEEADRRAREAEERLDRALAIVDKLKIEPPADQQEPARPTKESFANPDDYEAALVKYADDRAKWAEGKVAREAKAKQEEEQQRAIQTAQKAAREAYEARVEKAKTKYSDYAQIAESPDVPVTMPVAAAILHSENGPDLQYYLGKNPDEARRIAQLSPPLQLMELGRIEARIMAGTAKPSISSTPAPIKPTKPAPETPRKSADEESMEEYAARRHKEMQSMRGTRH